MRPDKEKDGKGREVKKEQLLKREQKGMVGSKKRIRKEREKLPEG